MRLDRAGRGGGGGEDGMAPAFPCCSYRIKGHADCTIRERLEYGEMCIGSRKQKIMA